MRKHPRLGYAAAATKPLLFAALLCAAAAGPHKPAPQAAPRFESEQLWGTTNDINWEPTIAADPASSWIYQLTSDQKSLHILFRSSSDGGNSWNPARVVCDQHVKKYWQYDPQIAVASNGAIYVSCLNKFNPGVVFTKSEDHGATWTAPVAVDGGISYSDKPLLAISSSGADVYIAFNVADSLYVVSSHDSGKTFARKVKVNTEKLWYYPYSGAVGPDGAVYYAVDGESSSRDDPDQQVGFGRLELVRSADGGKTWTTTYFATTQEGQPCKGPNCYPDFYTGEDAIAVDASGAGAFVYARNEVRHGPNELFVSTSPDGVDWSEPVLFNALGNNTSPALAAGPAPGDFRLAWQDNRNGLHAWNTWYSSSTDGGQTWSTAVRLSDKGSGARYKTPAGYYFPFGDYFGLAVNSEGRNFVIWGEGIGVYTRGGTWFTRGE
jgi:hypothetical protein